MSKSVSAEFHTSNPDEIPDDGHQFGRAHEPLVAISGAARETDEFALKLGDRQMRVRAGVDAEVAVGQIRRRFVVLVGVR